MARPPMRQPEFGELIRTRCQELGITLKEAHTRARVARSSFYAGIAGRRELDSRSLHRICVALAIPFEEMAETIGWTHPRLQAAIRFNVAPTQLRACGYSDAPPQTIAGFTRYAELIGLDASSRVVEGRQAVRLEGDTTPLGRVLADHMLVGGLTPAELAARLGVSRQGMMSWMAGRNRPTEAARGRISGEVGVSVEEVDQLVEATYQKKPSRRKGRNAASK